LDGVIGLARADKKVKLNTSSTPDTGKTSFLKTFDLMEKEEN
jgi:hypothetical protein